MGKVATQKRLTPLARDALGFGGRHSVPLNEAQVCMLMLPSGELSFSEWW